jgi:type IV secretion system protein VirB6
MNGIFSFLSSSMDNALDAFVVKVSSSLAAGIAPIVVSGVTIYILCYGLAVMRGEVHDPVNTFVWKAIKLSMIFGFSLSAGVYQSEIAGGANDIASGLVQLVSPNNADGVFAALDQFDALGGQFSQEMIEGGTALLPIGGYGDILCGYLVLFADVALLGICGGWALVAKVSLTFVLAFGPLFIASLAFPPTAKFFDAWFGKVMNYILLMVFMAAVTTFAVEIATSYMNTIGANIGAVNKVSAVFGFILLSFVLVLVTWQMPNIAASLAGGSALSGGGFGNLLIGVAMGRNSGGGKGGKGDSSGGGRNGGGSIKDISGGGGSGGRGRDSGGSRVPAYRRATVDRMQGKRH